ncbi:MAG: hypothetical protein WBA45_15215 [Microthrixaceae bacterium]
MPTHDHNTQSADRVPSAGRPSDQQYEIRVAGHLGSRWEAWFEGLELVNEADGTTVMSGPVVDQAALHGLLAKLRDLGIPLVSVTRLPADGTTSPSDLKAPYKANSSHNTSGGKS